MQPATAKITLTLRRPTSHVRCVNGWRPCVVNLLGLPDNVDAYLANVSDPDVDCDEGWHIFTRADGGYARSLKNYESAELALADLQNSLGENIPIEIESKGHAT